MNDTIDRTVSEQEARINQLQADMLLKLMATMKRDQGIRFAPWALLATGVGAAAAIFGAAIAVLKWVG